MVLCSRLRAAARCPSAVSSGSQQLKIHGRTSHGRSNDSQNSPVSALSCPSAAPQQQHHGHHQQQKQDQGVGQTKDAPRYHHFPRVLPLPSPMCLTQCQTFCRDTASARRPDRATLPSSAIRSCQGLLFQSPRSFAGAPPVLSARRFRISRRRSRCDVLVAQGKVVPLHEPISRNLQLCDQIGTAKRKPHSA
jgi:hypothetical protein